MSKVSFYLFVAVAVLLKPVTTFGQYTDWKHSGSLYILTTPDGAELPASAQVKDFPLLVRLDKDWFDFRQVQPKGQDVRFSTTSGEPMSYQIEEWDPVAGAASIWVRVPKIQGNTSQEIRMHWGRVGVESRSDGTAVFNASNGYSTVWHLNGTSKDSTGTLVGTDSGTTPTPGIIGLARRFPGGKGFDCGTSITAFPQGSNSHTTEVWARAVRPNGRVVGWGLEQKQGKVTMFFASPPHVRMDCYFSDANVESVGRLPIGEWVHLVHTYSKGKARVYVNGQLDGENNGRGATLNIQSPARMYIGGWYRNYDFIGDLDEVRVSSVQRSADWIKLQYENQRQRQSAIGSLVQPGTEFATSHQEITIDEGTKVTVTAQAGGAQKVSWILKQDGEETVVAVDRFRFTFDAGRVTGDRDLVLRFKAVYEDGVKTIDIPVSVQEAIFEPAFTLQAPSNWNGRQSIEIISDVTNLKQMQAQGADKLDYDWRVSGLATINRSELGKLVLKRAQNSGTVTITATISNGGAGVSASTTIEVKEPNYDAWVQRVPDKDEKPQDNQFYARDDTNLGTAYCNGTLTQTADALLLKLYSDDKLIKTLTQKPTQGDAYSFAVKLKPGLIKYRIELVAETDEKETILHQATNLVCGDAYIIEGQSNALATDTREQSPLETNEWIRSFATVRAAENDPTNLWCNPVWKSGREHKAQLGWWGMELAKRLVRSQKIPICIINGAAGGTRIDQHQRSESNPTDPETIYGRLLWRVQEAKLTHGIRAVLWHQGESDQGAAGPDGGYGWETYQQYFVRMSAAWKQDFPNIRHYYVYQIWPNACSMGNGNGDMLRERQRTLPSLFSNMAILSTLGIQPGGGCHYPLEGWTKFAEMVQPLIERDLYARDALRFLTPPNLKRASYTNSAKDAIALEFDQAVAWDDKLVGQFYLDNEEGAVASGSVSGSVVTLKLKGKMATGKITYLKEMQWSQDKLLLGKNGLAALTFCQVPIEEPVEVTTDPDFYTTDTLASRPVPRPFSHMWSLWMKRHNDLADGLAQQKKVDLLVVGDSIAFRFERGGHNIWKKYYEKRNGYNFASSGDRTEHILWRLQNGKLDTIQPKLAMLLIGTNNTSRAEETPEETAYAIEAITKELKKRLPSAKILLLGIFPRGAQVDDRNRLRNDQVNAIISKLDDGKKIFYLDVGNKFLNPDNSLNKQLINDTVHPVEKGFEVWAEAMESTIVKLMGE